MFQLLARFHALLLRLLREVSNRGDPTIRVIDGFRRCERGIEMSGAYSSIPDLRILGKSIRREIAPFDESSSPSIKIR